MAMAVLGKNRYYHWAKILRRHWFDTARLCSFSEYADSLIAEVIDQTPNVLQKVSTSLPRRFPAAVANSILRGLEQAVRRLA
jgi:serine/threonine-protein kinase HipA